MFWNDTKNDNNLYVIVCYIIYIRVWILQQNTSLYYYQHIQLYNIEVQYLTENQQEKYETEANTNVKIK